MIKTENIKIAIVGAGSMAREHLRAFTDISNLSVAGICSRTRAKAIDMADEFSIEMVCDSIPELYSKTKADLLIISVPELQTRAVCTAAFEFDWTCLIEKPVGYNLTEARAIFEAYSITSCNAFVAFNRRHYSSTQAVMSELEASSGQRVIHVIDQEDPERALKNGAPAEVVKNWMFANSIHLIDYFKIFARGEVVSVENVVSYVPDKPFYVMSRINYSSGDIGIYEAIWNAPGPWSVSVSTPECRWELRPLEQATKQLRGSRQLIAFDKHKWDIDFKPGFRKQAEEAVKALSLQPHNLPSLSESLATMELVSAIYAT